jgi:transposase
MMEDAEEKARKRLAVILQVTSGNMEATEGAKALNVSREAYYKWQNRAMDAMLESLEDRASGRPANQVDVEKERLQKDLEKTKQELEEAITALDIKKTLEDLRAQEKMTVVSSGRDVKKNIKLNRAARRR